jgi:hypothetical protein
MYKTTSVVKKCSEIVTQYTGAILYTLHQIIYICLTQDQHDFCLGWPEQIDIPVDRYGGVQSLQICTSSKLWSPTCHQASQQENTYLAKYQKADRASTLCA